MYTVKFFIKGMMRCPVDHKFRSLTIAKSFVKQTIDCCEKLGLPYTVTLFNKQKVYMDIREGF